MVIFKTSKAFGRGLGSSGRKCVSENVWRSCSATAGGSALMLLRSSGLSYHADEECWLRPEEEHLLKTEEE